MNTSRPETSWRGGRFAGRLLGLGAAFTAAYLTVIRPWHSRWGATDEEVQRTMPGDDEVPHPWMATARAITIDASPEAVWPWLVQMGFGRAGWYSYDRIDNRGVQSAEQILPEYQNLRVGDVMPEGPETGYTVSAIEPNRLLILTSCGVMKDANWCERHSSWAFVLEPRDGQRTRLIARGRTALNHDWRTWLFFLIGDPGDFLMARKQLLGIRRRAEQGQRPAVSRAA